jgi:hypothetical protein
VDAASSTLAPVQWQEQQGREDMPTDSNKEHGPLLGDASIRELLLEIAAAEESLVQASQQRGGQDTAQAQHRLEAAVGKILDHPQHLLAILALLGPAPPSPQEKDADLPEGLRQLNAREEYGAVRAICWVLVVSAGRGVERPLMLSVLSALPMVLPEMREQLIANITNARVDGRLILDASYLEDLLFLRSQYPDDALVFSALFVVMGDDLTDEQRHNLFSQFYIVTDDPSLVGLTLKNLYSAMTLTLVSSWQNNGSMTRAWRRISRQPSQTPWSTTRMSSAPLHFWSNNRIAFAILPPFGWVWAFGRARRRRSRLNTSHWPRKIPARGRVDPWSWE